MSSIRPITIVPFMETTAGARDRNLRRVKRSRSGGGPGQGEGGTMRRVKAGGNQRGILIIWLALFLMMMIGFVAIGVDLAKLGATQGQLQTAADAAALAAGTAIESN